MTKHQAIDRLSTGINNLDAILGGGFPKGSMIVFGGAPGSAKTILSQQIGFNVASKDRQVLFIHTLSEPTVKTLLYMQQFKFFNEEKLHDSVKFVDLGVILKTKGLEAAASMIMDHVKRESPALTVIDSFRVFEDLAASNEELRKFTYQLLVNLIAWESTTLLLGEFRLKDIATNPLFSVVDGIVMMTQEEISSEQRRFIQVSKLRGSDHNRDKNPFEINDQGIEIYAPRVTLQKTLTKNLRKGPVPRIKTGIGLVDKLAGSGVPVGTTLIVSGKSGTGKTLMLLEFLYRGAKEFGEKGLFVSFQESDDNLIDAAESLGWDFRSLIDQGMIEILYVPQPKILVEGDLLQIENRITTKTFKRIAIDSISSFLYKVIDTQLAREKYYQLTTMVQNAGAVCFMANDSLGARNGTLPFAADQALVDGQIFLYAKKEGLTRRRYLEIAKLRQTSHSLGLHPIRIDHDGIKSQELGSVSKS